MIAALKNGDPNDFLRSLDRYTNIIPYSTIDQQLGTKTLLFWAILLNLSPRNYLDIDSYIDLLGEWFEVLLMGWKHLAKPVELGSIVYH